MSIGEEMVLKIRYYLNGRLYSPNFIEMGEKIKIIDIRRYSTSYSFAEFFVLTGVYAGKIFIKRIGI